jgi:protein TonB
VDFAESQRRPGKHPVGLIIVIVLHLLLGWALLSGLARKVVEVVKAPIETKIIEEVKPPPPPPPENLPPPPKNLPPPPAFVPPPEVQVAQPQAPTITTTNVQPPPQGEDQPGRSGRAGASGPARTARGPPGDRRHQRLRAQGVRLPAGCRPRQRHRHHPCAFHRGRFRQAVEGRGGEVVGPVPRTPHARSRRGGQAQRVLVPPGIDDNGHPVGGTFEFEYVWTLQ